MKSIFIYDSGRTVRGANDWSDKEKDSFISNLNLDIENLILQSREVIDEDGSEESYIVFYENGDYEIFPEKVALTGAKGNHD